MFRWLQFGRRSIRRSAFCLLEPCLSFCRSGLALGLNAHPLSPAENRQQPLILPHTTQLLASEKMRRPQAEETQWKAKHTSQGSPGASAPTSTGHGSWETAGKGNKKGRRTHASPHGKKKHERSGIGLAFWERSYIKGSQLKRRIC